MKPVEIYTSPLCGFCHAAKRLLAQKGATFTEIDVLRQPERKAEMIQRANGGRTVPQIFIEEIHVGGCDDLYALERAGKLDGLGGMMRTALLQINSSPDPLLNFQTLQAMVADAVAEGAGFVLTPEVTNCLGAPRARQNEILHPEASDPTLAGLRQTAVAHGIWILIGSLALKTEDADGRFANRSLLIDPAGRIVARYDKAHMFDVQISETEQYRESKAYRPGTRAVCAQTPFGTIGLSVCYDLRFPYLYRILAHSGAQILTVPAAFSYATGPAHWEPLLRARAIECGAWVLAPAQTGSHGEGEGALRRTHGHSLVVSPWGEVVADAGADPGMVLVELDMAAVAEARKRIPSLTHDRDLTGPE